MQYSFDELKDLYESDPSAFEVQRSIILNDALNKLSPRLQKELRSQLSMINKIRENCTPEEALQHSFTILGSSLEDLNKALNLIK